MTLAEGETDRLVDALERRIARRYDLELRHRVREFVLHDAETLHALSGAERGSEEVVLLREGDGELEFTLYLSASVCARAVRALAQRELGDGGLDALCTLVEGVSHGVCVLWHARHARELRPLDLELQAEIDKYLVLSHDLGVGGALARALFERVRYTAAPGSALEARYRRANGHAARYCRWLERRFPARGAREGLRAELARFYRLSGHAKARRIERCRPHR